MSNHECDHDEALFASRYVLREEVWQEKLVAAAQAASEWLERLATMSVAERRSVTLSELQQQATAHNTPLSAALAALRKAGE